MASAKEFVQSPSMEVLETFKKDMLMQIAQELQLEVKRSTRKHELKRLIVEQLVEGISLYQWNLLGNMRSGD